LGSAGGALYLYLYLYMYQYQYQYLYLWYLGGMVDTGTAEADGRYRHRWGGGW
jgi:hypothetical protein